MGCYHPDHVKEQIRSYALSLGFAACGFTHAEALDCAPVFADWLRHGRHGLMDYLARTPERRTEPRAAMPEAESVLVLAWPYPAPPPMRSDWRGMLRGRIAAYALGNDYHDVLGVKLGELAASMDAACGARTRWYVDTGPLVEKDLARRAGLGWYGHNTNVLSRTGGSYFLLGCILTDARFEPDAPFTADHCGTCRACVPACPTGALDEGPTIDARKCISYLTIEHRGPIDEQLRAGLGSWIFGCDVCQQVCPWSPAADPGASDFLEPYLPDLLLIDTETFRQRYAHTAVARAKRRGLARNAAVVLGNTGNPEAVEPLAFALREHDEPLVRAHAAWSLGRIGGDPAVRTLEHAASREAVPPVLAEIAAALARRSMG
jgi:epoxyqueuosine reductase